MFKTSRWQRWLVTGAMIAACFAPQVASAARRGQNIPFVITAMGPIRKSDYYAHLMTPQQRAAQRKLEDDYIEKVKKQQQAAQGRNQQPTTVKK